MRVGVTLRSLSRWGAAIAVASTVVLLAASAYAQQRTARQCADEWRANKADNQAKGITEKAFVTQCRSGGATAQPTTTTTPTNTSPPPAPTATPKQAAPRVRETTAVAPSGFGNEAQAKARCPADTVVWVNEKSRIYHFSGHKDYGNTKEGTYMCEKDAMAAGDRAAKNEKHP